MLRFALFVGVSVFAVLPALAGEIRPASRIESVTVFPQGANVLRRVPVTLPAGASVVVIDDLPLGIETDSLTVDGATDTPVAIGSVETRIVPAGTALDPAREALLADIQSLEDRLAVITDRSDALAGRRAFLEKLIEATPDGFGKALADGSGGIDGWAKAAVTIGDGLAEVAVAARGLAIEQRGIEKSLAAKRDALAALPAPSDHTSVRIEVAAEAAASGALTIAYRTPAAGWVPAYDAQLATGENGGTPSIAIVRRAEVAQATGEDWRDVALSLSTVQPAVGTAAPELQPVLADFYSDNDFSRSDAMAESATSLAAAPPPPMPAPQTSGGALAKPVALIEAAADFGDFRAEYKVPGAVSVASGAGVRALRIATERGDVALEVRSVPSVTQAAYLTARFTAQSGAPFLGGKVSLFRDGAFVGSGALAFTQAGKPLELGFGVDDRVRVVRTALDRATGEHGLLSSRKTDTRRYRITVENLHRLPVAITVLDRMPYAENDEIAITRLADATPPTAENLDDRRGVLAWTYDYKPGESREIRNAYEVSWPAGASLVLAD